MILNSSYDYDPDDPGSYDLFTVALHEAGHVFGFADSSAASLVHVRHLYRAVTGLAPGAVPALQSLYGPRNINALDGYAVSTDPAHPVNLNLPWNSNGSPTLVTAGDLATASVADAYQLQWPGGNVAPAGVDVRVQTAGISLLAPTVSVYDASNHLVATASASGPLAGGASVHLAGLVAGQKYSIEVSGATGDVFSVGGYQLAVSATQATNILPGGAPKNAQAVQEAGNYSGSTPLTTADGITQPSDVDLYSFRTLTLNPNGVTIQLQQLGVGLLAPQVKVFDSLGNLVGSATGAVGTNSVATISVPVVVSSSTYYVQVASGLLSPRSEGVYSLSVAFNPSSAAAMTTTTALAMPWLGSNWSGQANPALNLATNLQTPAGYAQGTDYAALGGLGPASPQGYFQFGSPNVPQGRTVYMTATVESLQAGGLMPKVTILDQKGNAIPSQVLASQSGVTVVQFAVVANLNQYILEVSQTGPGGPSGSYSLGITASAIGSSLGTFASGTLASVPAGSTAGASQSTAFQVAQPALYQFVLAAGSANAGTDAVLRATILDASGNVVATIATAPGQAASLDVFLPPGSYTILIAESSASGMALTPETYTFAGDSLTDPIKPYPTSGGSGGSHPR